MNFVYNSNTYELPDTLSDITLEQHIGWSSMFGYTLRSQARNTALQNAVLFLQSMYMALAYYTGLDFVDLKTNVNTGDAGVAFGSSALKNAIEEIGLIANESEEDRFLWGDTTWEIFIPETSVSNPITEEEFRQTIENARVLFEVLNRDWQNAKGLIATYFRHADELFDPSLLEARTEAMSDLPLDIVFAVIHRLSESQQSFVTVIDAYLSQVLPYAP